MKYLSVRAWGDMSVSGPVRSLAPIVLDQLGGIIVCPWLLSINLFSKFRRFSKYLLPHFRLIPINPISVLLANSLRSHLPTLFLIQLFSSNHHFFYNFTVKVWTFFSEDLILTNSSNTPLSFRFQIFYCLLVVPIKIH